MICSLMLFACEGSDCFREPQLPVCCAQMKMYVAPPAMPGSAKLGGPWPRLKQTRRQDSETCEPDFAIVPQLCGQTDSDLAETNVLITIGFPSWFLKNINERTGVGGTAVLGGASLPPTEGSGVWVHS